MSGGGGSGGAVERVDVAVVGGGPAGAIVAALVARAGQRVVVLERSWAYRWRAGGVFASPAAVAALRRIGLDEEVIRRVARPIPAMRVEVPGAPPFRLTYGDDGSLAACAVGFDRGALDPALLDLATAAGADLRAGATCVALRPWDVGVRMVTQRGGDVSELEARLVVGADGIRSTVARSLGEVLPAAIARRVGLTFHLADERGDGPLDARMHVLRDGYVGVAPVPGGRVNIGIVLGPSWRERLGADGPAAVATAIVRSVPTTAEDSGAWRFADRCDEIVGAFPLGHRVARRAGERWLLAGDAAGFLDPFTGEGLHRAIVSAELAAAACVAHLGGRSDALARYERQMRARFATKDVVSRIVQAFLARPRPFGYAARRLAERADVRETMGLVMGDLVPASRALDPRFLAALLRP